MKVFSGSAIASWLNASVTASVCRSGAATSARFRRNHVKIGKTSGPGRFSSFSRLVPPPNQHLMELLSWWMRPRASADRINSRHPVFFGYARPGPQSISLACRSPRNWWRSSSRGRGQRVLTMDLPAQRCRGFRYPGGHLYSMPVLLTYVRTRLTRKTVVRLPGRGGLKWLRLFAGARR